MYREMPDPIAGVSPDTVPDTIPSPAAVSPPASSLTTQEAAPDFNARVQSANSPDSVLKLIKDLQTSPAPAKPVKPVEEKPAKLDEAEGDKPIEDANPDGPPEADGDKPAEAEKPAGDAPPADPDADDPDPKNEDDDSVAPVSASKVRLRIPEGDKVGRLALAFLQRNRDWTMEQAMKAANDQLGTAKPEPKPATDKPAEPAERPLTIAEIDAQIEQIEAERSKAVKELRWEDTDEHDKKLRRLDRKRFETERAAETQKAEERQQVTARYRDEFGKSNAQAIEFYPDAGNAESSLAKRMVEIEQALEDTKDPLFRDSNKPLIVAQMAAKELRIAPKAKGSAPAKPTLKPAAPALPATKPKQVLPAGGSTTAPVANPHAEMTTNLQSVTNPEQLKHVLQKHGIRLPNV